MEIDLHLIVLIPLVLIVKKFDSWSNAGRLKEPNIWIGNDNASWYIKSLDEKLAKIIE